MNVRLTMPASIAGSRIAGLGHYQPPTVVTNDDLVARGVNTNDEWIRTRVGIAERRFAVDETMVDMATAAASKALAHSGVDPSQVDLVVLATCTNAFQVPGGAATVADRLGISAPGAYDLNAACAGFVYGLASASNAVMTGQARNVLVVGSEKLTDYVDMYDRSTGIIFGDGAGAAVVSAADRVGIGPVTWGSDGSSSQTITTDPASATLRQEGQSVFRWATSQMAEVGAACLRAGRYHAERSRRVRPAPGQPAHHRVDRQAARAAGVGGGRPRHHHLGQHLLGLHPDRAVQADRAGRGDQRRAGADHRLRRRTDLCGTGDPRPVIDPRR